MTRAKEERGSTILLIIGMSALALALVVAVVDATSLYLERKRLFTLADGAALVAAQAFEPSAERPLLTISSVNRAAVTYLTHVSSTSKKDAHIVLATTVDSKTAIVRVGAQWHPPVISVLMPAGLAITVEASARTFFSSARN